MKSKPEKVETISTAKLAELCNLTSRRINQLVNERKISAPVLHGEFDLCKVIPELFKLYQGAHGDIAEERLKLLRAKRRIAETKLHEITGGDSVPFGVIEQAAAQTRAILSRFASECYNTGVSLDADARARIQHLADNAAQDFQTYIKQWLDRQIEIQNQNAK